MMQLTKLTDVPVAWPTGRDDPTPAKGSAAGDERNEMPIGDGGRVLSEFIGMERLSTLGRRRRWGKADPL